MRHRRRWSCWQDLYAYLLHQQHLPHCEYPQILQICASLFFFMIFDCRNTFEAQIFLLLLLLNSLRMNEKENYGFILLSMQYLEEKYMFFYVVFVSRENRKKMKESIIFMANLLK